MLSHVVFAVTVRSALRGIPLVSWRADGRRDTAPSCTPMFFMDTTLGRRTTFFMVMLMAVMGVFFALFVHFRDRTARLWGHPQSLLCGNRFVRVDKDYHFSSEIYIYVHKILNVLYFPMFLTCTTTYMLFTRFHT